MKKKSLFKKVMSLICCLTVCLATFAPAAYAAATKEPGVVILEVSDDVTLIDQYGTEMTNSAAEGDNYTCSYDETAKIVKLISDNNDKKWINGETIVFYAKAVGNLKFDTNNIVLSSMTCVELDEEDNGYGGANWKIELKISKPAAREGVVLTPKVEAKMYNVTFPSERGNYTIKVDNNVVTGTTQQYEAGQIGFTVVPVDGKDVVVWNGDEKIDPAENGVYTLDVNKDIVLDFQVIDKQYTVTAPETNNNAYEYVPVGTGKVSHGGSFNFYVNPKPGYSNIKVTAANTDTKENVPVSSLGYNQYMINGITSNVTIVVDAGELDKYTVTLLPNDGITYGKSTDTDRTIAYGKEYIGEITLNAEYTQSTPVVSVNGIPVATTKVDSKANTYTYTISNITENKTVSVGTLAKNTYQVTFVNGEGYTFTTNDSTKVTAGENFRFNLNIADGYEGIPTFTVSDNHMVEKNDNGGWIIKNVSGDITISVAGIKGKTYSATISADSSVNAKVELGNNANSIPYGGIYSFTVTSKPGYRVTQVSVNGIAREAVGNEYTIDNVTANLTINVVTVENKLTVSFYSAEKNHIAPASVTYSYSEINVNGLPTISGCAIHDFERWVDSKGENVTDSKLEELITNNDASVTLTAKFTVNDGAISNFVTLAKTTKQATQIGNDWRVTFRTNIETFASDPCFREYVRITGHGTMYAATDIGAENFELAKALLGERNTTLGAIAPNEPIIDQGIDSVINIYTNCDYDWDGFVSAIKADEYSKYIALRINNATKNKDKLRAAGWIELTIGNEKVYILSAESGTGMVGDNPQTVTQ